MFEIVLYQPEIPPNTGNIIRIAANTGCRLHLVRPLGFQLNERAAKRAGLDYSDSADLVVHVCWEDCLAALAGTRMFAFTTKATRNYAEQYYNPGDALLFGPESRGLPAEVLERFPEMHRLRLPMLASSRSLNLSNCVAAVVYEAWRQTGFVNAATK